MLCNPVTTCIEICCTRCSSQSPNERHVMPSSQIPNTSSTVRTACSFLLEIVYIVYYLGSRPTVPATTFALALIAIPCFSLSARSCLYVWNKNETTSFLSVFVCLSRSSSRSTSCYHGHACWGRFIDWLAIAFFVGCFTVVESIGGL